MHSRCDLDLDHAGPDPSAWLASMFCVAGLRDARAIVYTDFAGNNRSFAPRAADEASKAIDLWASARTRATVTTRIPLVVNAYRAGDTTLSNDNTSKVVGALAEINSRRPIADRLRPIAAEAATHDSMRSTSLITPHRPAFQ